MTSYTTLRTYAIPIFLLILSVTLLLTQHFPHFTHVPQPPTLGRAHGDQSLLPTLPYENLTVTNLISRRTTDHTLYGNRFPAFYSLFVTEYLHKHRHFRTLCAQYPSVANQMRLLVFNGSRHNLGLGDRVRGLLVGYILAVMTERLFLIDLPAPFPITHVWQSPPGLNFTYDPTVFPINDTDLKLSGGIRRPSWRLRPDLREFSGDERVVVMHSMPRLRVGRLVQRAVNIPKFHTKLTHRKLNNFRPDSDFVAPLLLKRLVRPTALLRKRMASRVPFEGRAYVAVHARLGHGLRERGGRFNFSEQALNISDISRCIGRAGARTARKKGLTRVLIVSDTRKALDWIREGVLEDMAEASVEFTEGRTKHLNRIRDRRLDGGDYQAYLDVFVDVGLLAAAKGLVYFRSGFADIALWMGGITDGELVSNDECAKEISRAKVVRMVVGRRK